MTSWLIVNHFLDTAKFRETQILFEEAAKRNDITLKIITNAELMDIPDSLPDFAILWDKDYNLAKRLENRGLRLFNSADAMLLCDDKARTFTRLEQKNIAMPKTLIAPKTFLNIGYTGFDFVEKAADILGLPFVVKECFGSFGQQVYLVDSVSKAKEIIKKIGGRGAVFQELIRSSYGVDLRLNVVGNRVISAMKRQGDGFISNITAGGTATVYTPTKAETSLALEACRALDMDFAGVDLLIGENGPLICEVNSNLQFRSALDVTGVNLADEIFAYIKETL